MGVWMTLQIMGLDMPPSRAPRKGACGPAISVKRKSPKNWTLARSHSLPTYGNVVTALKRGENDAPDPILSEV